MTGRSQLRGPRAPRRRPLVLITSLWALSLLACADVPDNSGVVPPLFRVTAAEGQTSVLMGTIHSIVDVDELAEVVWDEFALATRLTTEADVRHISSAEFLRAITLTDGQTIQQEVSAEEWAAIVSAFEGLRRAESIDTLEPWYLEGELTRSMLPEAENIDTALVENASARVVWLSFLEGWLGQVQMLNGVDFDESLRRLLTTVNDPEGVRAANLEWADAYRAGDLATLEVLAFDPELMAEQPSFYENIVFARSEAWIAQLLPMLTEGSAFIAVGFMHLLGDRGLIALLEDQGYLVERIEG